MSFCHFHLHSEFSLLDGCGSSKLYAKRAKELGQTSLALTDHSNMAGALYHLEACNEEGIKPIFGLEAYFRPDAKVHDKSNWDYWHLLLIAKNQEGFRNLMRLTSESYREENFYRKPCVDWEMLTRFSDGLIATSTCTSGYVPDLALKSDSEGMIDALNKFLAIFGDDYFIEIQPHDFELQRQVNPILIKTAEERGLPLLATVDAHYPLKGWDDTHDVLLMINTGTTVKKREQDLADDKDVLRFGAPTFYLMDRTEVGEEFIQHHLGIGLRNIQQALDNTEMLANSVNHISYGKQRKMPRVKTDSELPIRTWCAEGLIRIGKNDDEEYWERLEMELALFKKLDCMDYFYIIGDLVRWAKRQGIRVGAGRGSACASLVLYLIGVTAIDPIGYGLLFQRFMNEFRTELPDVDIDFQHDRRDEAIEYLRDKYGEDNVANVSAFQSFGMKSCIKNISRVLDLPFRDAERASKVLDDQTFGDTLEDLVEKKGYEDLAEYKEKYPEAWKHATRLEGQISRLSKHPAAVVITDQPVSELMPTMRADRGKAGEVTVTQWSERANAPLISTYGFLKIDALATNSLTIQQDTINLIKERHNIVVDFEDPHAFPVITDPTLSEKEIIDGFVSGHNLGIFQFGAEGSQIIPLVRQIQPDNLEHIIAANALYRPGPLASGMTFEYAKRKNGEEKWSLPHPAAKPILDASFGIIAYQEQVMQLCMAIGGFEANEAAVALKVIAKGVARDIEGRKKLDAHKKPFLRNAIKNGIYVRTAIKIWREMLDMASYSFNRPHAAGYALQAYQDMWLKKNYALEFYSSLLSHEPDKVARIVREALWGSDIMVLPPDINQSEIGFSLSGDTIRYGLFAIKGVGEVAAQEILEKRPFSSLEDFDSKITKKKCNKTVRTALIECGAMDSLGLRSDWSLEQKSEAEIRLIGYSNSEESSAYTYRDIIRDIMDEDPCNIGGEIISVRNYKTKKGKPYARCTLWFDNSETRCTIWSEAMAEYFDAYPERLEEGQTVLFHGRWDHWQGDSQFNVTYARTIEEYLNESG